MNFLFMKFTDHGHSNKSQTTTLSPSYSGQTELTSRDQRSESESEANRQDFAAQCLQRLLFSKQRGQMKES